MQTTIKYVSCVFLLIVGVSFSGATAFAVDYTQRTAQCKDGSYSYSQIVKKVCASSGGVNKWLNKDLSSKAVKTLTKTKNSKQKTLETAKSTVLNKLDQQVNLISGFYSEIKTHLEFLKYSNSLRNVEYYAKLYTETGKILDYVKSQKDLLTSKPVSYFAKYTPKKEDEQVAAQLVYLIPSKVQEMKEERNSIISQGQTSKTNSTYQDQGCTTAKDAYEEYNAQVSKEVKRYKSEEDQIRANTAGALASGVQSQLSEASRNHYSRMADLAISGSSLLSAYQSACSPRTYGSSTSAIDAYLKYQPVQTTCSQYGNNTYCTSY